LLALAGHQDSVEDAVRIVTSRLLEGIPCPPTDLDVLADRLDINGIVSEDILISGELRKDSRGFSIVYSSHLSASRLRFTIAHELGHAIMERTGPNAPRSGRELERICDMFAAEILMPRTAFLEALGDTPSIRKVFELARLFEASLIATLRRCCDLADLAAFSIENGKVGWSRGVSKNIADEVASIMQRVLEGEWVTTNVFLGWGGVLREWHLEGAPVGGEGNYALFLLVPLRVGPENSVKRRSTHP
jgi:hypothetical protein